MSGYSLQPNLQPKQTQNLRQMQRLMMSPQMQQALHYLQLPIQELSAQVEIELEQNPVIDLTEEEGEEGPSSIDEGEKRIDFDENNFEIFQRLDDDFASLFNEAAGAMQPRSREEDKLHTFLESSIEATPSLFEHLMQQAQETFVKPEQLKIAEEIIGNFDENGFLTTDLKEIAELTGIPLPSLRRVLRKIQTFEPCGVGANSLQQALLLQLRAKGKRKTLAYRILSEYYKDLLHNHIPRIRKGLNCTTQEINHAVEQEIACLDMHPGVGFKKGINAVIRPDLKIALEGDIPTVNANQDAIPEFHFNRKYIHMLRDENLPLDTKEFIKSKLLAAKWLLRSIDQRGQTLERIGSALAKHQASFFASPEGELKPLTMRELADELEIHESTVARAVANKYVDTPRGIFPLRYFFSNEYEKMSGEKISSTTVRDLLKALIDREDKQKPLSDEALADQIKAQGIDCARRTVAKYRAEMQLGNAHQRKRY